MNEREKVAASIAFPAGAFVAAMAGMITFDMAISAIQWMLAVSPVILVIDGFRRKRGQPLVAMTALGAGLTFIGTMFFLMDLFFVGVAAFSSGLLWAVLAAQSVVYRNGAPQA